MKRLGGPGGGSWEPGAPVAWWEKWSVLRMLRHDRWFAVVVTALIGLGLLVPVGFVRWIPGSRWPDGRAWRLSGIHWLGCRWHDLTMGRPGDPRFRPDTARWSRRVSADPADVMALRGYLDSMLADPGFRGAAATNGLRWGAWLWRVGGTNRDDVHRMFRVASRVEDPGRVLDELAPWLSELSEGDLEPWLVELAESGRWAEIGRLVAGRRDESSGSNARLIALAWRAGWGPAAGALEALQALERFGAAGGSEGVMADRLLLRVLCRRLDWEGVRRSLNRLEKGGSARSVDRLRVGMLALETGRAKRMVEEILSWASPEAPGEVLEWHSLLVRMGEGGRATRMLRGAMQKWWREDWWLPLVDGQMGASDWQGLRETAGWLRQGKAGKPGWERVGWRLEAVLMERLGRTGDAAYAWRQGDGPLPSVDASGWEWGRRLLDWGFPQQASDWIRQREDLYAGRPEYWSARMRLAHGMGDADGLLEAALRVRLLAPTSVIAVNDHAAALLILRRDPSEALRLVRLPGVMEAGGAGVRINEALALVQLGELGPAETRLAALDLIPLTAMERTMVCLARFEVHARRGRVAEAMEMYRAIEGRFLMAAQLRWLESEYHRLRTLQDAERDQPRVRRP